MSLGVDVEPDCPPYLATQYRGIDEGLPRLLDVLHRAGISATCFCTGQVAERSPDRVREIVSAGHELGCHGHTHRRFDRMREPDARDELRRSSEVLRGFGVPVTSFRAPNLRFPAAFLPLLESEGFHVDSSQARYKAEYYRRPAPTTLTRIPASTTSSVLRLSPWIRDRWLAALRSPVVLFVHPWEFVDLTRERLRLDCRFRTGEPALRALMETISFFHARGATFVRMDELGARARGRPAPVAA